MSSFYKQEEDSLPLGKIIAGLVVVFLLIGGGMAWVAAGQNAKEAASLHARAEDHFKNKHLSEGLREIDRALKLQEKPEYLETKLNILLNQNKSSEGELVLERLIELRPDHAHYRYLSGNLAFNNGRLDDAEQRYREASEVEPDNGRYSVALANSYYHQGNMDEAKAIYESTIEKEPRYTYVWNQYINACSNAGRHEEALAVAQRAVKQAPDNSDFYFALAGVYDAMGKKPEAAAAYRKSLELEPMPNSIAAMRIFEITGKRVPPALEQMDTDTISFQTQGKVMYVNALVNDRPGRFLLDTGASTCVLVQSKAGQYNMQPGVGKMAVATGNGTVQAGMAFGSVQLGKHRLENIMFAVIPDTKLEADGIIGMDYLEKFRMTVDRGLNQITLLR